SRSGWRLVRKHDLVRRLAAVSHRFVLYVMANDLGSTGTEAIERCPRKTGKPVRIGGPRRTETWGQEAELISAAAQAFMLKLTKVFGPPLLLLPAKDLQVGPGIESRVVTIVEHDPHGVVADRPQLPDLDVPLACDRHPLIRAVALHLGGRTHDAEHFGRQLVALAVVEGDGQGVPVRADLELRRLDASPLRGLHLRPGPGGDLAIDLSVRAVRIGGDDRLSGIRP